MARPRARTSRMPSSSEMTPAATSALYWPIEWPAAKAGTGAGNAGRGPALTKGLEDRDRRGEDRGLRLLGSVERLGGTIPGEAADRFAKRGVGRGEHGRGGGRTLDQGMTHPDRLGSLAGEDEGKL